MKQKTAFVRVSIKKEKTKAQAIFSFCTAFGKTKRDLYCFGKMYNVKKKILVVCLLNIYSKQ